MATRPDSDTESEPEFVTNSGAPRNRPTPSLVADCASCAALCCIGLALDRGDAFAIDKPAGQPCPNLNGHLCTIHDTLDADGFSGCTAFDCHGAGQRVVQELHAGASWHDQPDILHQMMDDFLDLRRIHDQWHLLDAAAALPLTDQEKQAREQLIAAITAPVTRANLTDRAIHLPLRAAQFLTSLRHHVTRKP